MTAVADAPALSELSEDQLAALYDRVSWDQEAGNIILAELARRDRNERARADSLRARRADPVVAAWTDAAHAQMIDADRVTCGNLVRRGSRVNDPFTLWSGPEWLARQSASEELNSYWDQFGRTPTVAEWRSHQSEDKPADDTPATERETTMTENGTYDTPPVAQPAQPLTYERFREAIARRGAELAAAARGEVAVRRPVISGEQVLGYCEALLKRYARLPQAGLDAAVLWAAHAHMRDAEGVLVWNATPRMMFLSSEPGSGKSRALELLGCLCPATFGLDTEPTAAGLAWTLSSEHATALLDEGDLLFGRGKRHSSIRAILNSGTYRNGTVLRMRGSKGERQRVFGPVAIAGLDVMKTATGESLAPLFSRSIVIRMRKSPEAVPALDAEGTAVAAKIRTALSLWAASVRDDLAQAKPELPGWLVNRPAEIWTPLIAAADAAGGDWPARARAAAEELARYADLEDPGEDDMMSELAAMVAGWEG